MALQVENELLEEAGSRLYVEDLKGLGETVKHLRAEYRVAQAELAEMVERLNREGVRQVDLADAVGIAQPEISRMVRTVRARRDAG
jgi:predicted XRE-type DNA-binding protein